MKHTIFALSILMGLLLAAPARAQSTPYDCFNVYTFTGATAQTGQSNSSASAPCVAWRVTYTTTGFSSVTVAFQTSPDNSSWTTVPNTQCSTSPTTSCTFEGASPITDGVQGTGAYRIYSKYVRANVTSVSGSGSGQVVTYGYKGTSAAAGGGGSGSSGSSPGIAFVDAALGNGVTDATSAIQSALDTATIGTVMIPQGNYLFSGITIPEGKLIQCVGSGTLNTTSYVGTHTPVSALTYTGSSIAITGAWSDSDLGTLSIRNCNIIKQGSVGGTAIRSRRSIGSIFENNQILGFTKGIELYGDSGGVYFDQLRGNQIFNCTNAITSSNVSGNTANSITVADNTIDGANRGIVACAECLGWKIQRNDIERATGSGGFGIYLNGSSGHTLDTNWVECNGCSATTFTAINAAGSNTVFNNKLPEAETGDWVNLVVNSVTVVLNPNLNTGSPAQPFFLPTLQIRAWNVSALPACNGNSVSTHSTAADALVPVQGAIVAGGGSTYVSVFCNGTNWIVTSGTPSGISASGTSCTITAIVKGVITGASCI